MVKAKEATVKNPVRYVTDKAKAAIRREAAKGARDAMMPWVLLSVGLSLYTLSKRRRR